MALFVFMVFVLLSRARATVGQTAEERRIQLAALSLVWLAIFGLAVIIVIVYWKTNFPSEYVVVGKITNLTSPQVVEGDQDLFLRIHPILARDFEYDWRLISDRQFLDNVELTLQQEPNDGVVYKYKFAVDKDFYNGLVVIEYDRNSMEMAIKHGDKTTVIKPTAGIADGNPRAAPSSGTVFAASPPQAAPQDLIKALDDDDPTIRRRARKDLAELGNNALPSISEVLSQQTTDYRTRLGVLAALQEIGGQANALLSDAARCSILSASNDPDATLRGVAKAVLNSGVTVSNNCLLTVPARDWHPIDLTSDPRAGVFVLDDAGVIHRVVVQGSQTLLETIASVHLFNRRGVIAANGQNLFVATAALSGCSIFRYSLTNRTLDQRFVMVRSQAGKLRCGGIASGDEGFYFAFPSEEQVRHWADWNSSRSQNADIRQDSTVGLSSMALDRPGNRIFLVDDSGIVHYAKLSSANGEIGKIERFSEGTKATGQSIAIGSDTVFLASGKTVITLGLNDGKRTKLPAIPKSNHRGTVTGVAIDGSKRLWITSDAGTVEGPFDVH